MSDVTANLARRRMLRNAAMVAVVVPAALVAGCAPAPAPAPPPPVISSAPPPPPAPAPAPAPVFRGERG